MVGMRVAMRCDGGPEAGAGHVGRCAPVAAALSAAGAEVTIVGRFAGLAGELVRQTQLPVRAAAGGCPAGVDGELFDAAIVDLYGIEDGEMCALAGGLPIATMAEAARCEGAGVHIDFHLDRSRAEDGPRLLAGADYVPVDPHFAQAAAQAGVAPPRVRRALITLGGASSMHRLVEPIVRSVTATFDQAAIVAGGGLPVPRGPNVSWIDPGSALAGQLHGVDVAVTGAGMTAYELAGAGVPFVALLLADNQLRVGDGLARAGIAPVVDARSELDERALRDALAPLRSAPTRVAAAAAGRRQIDGRGAARIAAGLAERWRPAGA